MNQMGDMTEPAKVSDLSELGWSSLEPWELVSKFEAWIEWRERLLALSEQATEEIRLLRNDLGRKLNELAKLKDKSDG